MTVRLWARSLNDARLIAPAAEVDPDNGPLGDHLAFVTDDETLRCIACNRLLSAEEWNMHACFIDNDDISVDLDEEGPGLGWSLAFVGLVVALDAAILVAAFAGIAALVRWAL